MLKIIDDLLDVNEFSRPGRKLKKVLSVVNHYTGPFPNQKPKHIKDYFNIDNPRDKRYSSAHYVIGNDGFVLRLIPDDEVAYHCGTSQIDPTSGKVYTDLARNIFGNHASTKDSPNNASIGIEMIPIDKEGNFSKSTLESAVELNVLLLKKFGLPVEAVLTHNQIVGWKDCPLCFVRHPMLLDMFINDIKSGMYTLYNDLK